MVGKVSKYNSLKDKDYDYMRYVLRCGVVTAKQIMLKFNEDNIQRVYRRLQKLQTRGYVKNERIAHKVGVYLGTNFARAELGIDVTVPSKATIYTIQHDLLLNDLALYHEFLAAKQGFSFRYDTERELRFNVLDNEDDKDKLRAYNQNRDRIPDAVFYLQSPGKPEQRIWIELELNVKDKKRYDEKFRNFDRLLQQGEYDRIFYFVGSLKIKNALNAAREKLLNPDKVQIRDIPEEILKDRWEMLIDGASDGATGSGTDGNG